jgi:hypothetical protein
MNDLENLFRSAATLGESTHPVPGDVLARLERARADRRRRRLAGLAVPLTVVAVGAAVVLPRLGREPRRPPATAQPDAMPAAFVGIHAGRAGEYGTATGDLLRDLGPAAAVTGGRGRVWVSATTGCSSVVHPVGGDDAEAFSVSSRVPALALSPDGRSLAYAAERPVEGVTEIGAECGSADLVLRELATGAERRWTAAPGSGTIAQLAWSPDGTSLAFETVVCCDASVTIHVLATDAAPGAVRDVPAPVQVDQACRVTLPAYAGAQLVAVRECFADGGETPVVEIVEITPDGAVRSRRVLDDTVVALAAHDGHFLIAAYGSPEAAGELRYIGPDGVARRLGAGIDQISWAPGAPTSDADTVVTDARCSDERLSDREQRDREAYAAVLRELVRESERGRPMRYLTDHRVSPTPEGGGDISPFTPALLGCLSSGEIPTVPELLPVSGFDDPDIRTEGSGPLPRISDGALVELTAVKSNARGVVVTGTLNGGGGFDFRGWEWQLSPGPDGTWRVAQVLSSMIA